MKDPNLHSTIKTLALGYLDYLRKLVEARGGTIPTRTVVEVLVEKAMFPVRDYQEPDYASLVSSSVREFVKSPELQAAVRAVLSNPDVTALLERKTYAQVDHSLTFEILQPLAVRLLEAQHGLEFSDKDFDLVFAQLEDCLESKVDKYLLLTPLSTFSMDMEEAVVGPFTLRKLAPSEIAAFNDIDASAMSFVRVMPQGPATCAIELTQSVGWDGKESPLTALNSDRFWWFVACLKLVKSGPVHYSSIWVRPSGWTGTTFRQGPLVPKTTAILGKYELAASDLPELQRYWKFVETFAGKEQPFWHVAMFRFTDAIDRVRDDEALIDLWIACESLFGDETEQGELTYRLSLRLAHFVSSDPREREQIREAARDAYKGRSSLLHGARKLDAVKMRERRRKMEDLMRAALRKCVLEPSISHDQMLEKIEASIVG